MCKYLNDFFAMHFWCGSIFCLLFQIIDVNEKVGVCTLCASHTCAIVWSPTPISIFFMPF